MTPKEFCHLVFIIRLRDSRDNKSQANEDAAQSKSTLNSKFHSARIPKSGKSESYFTDRASTNHPETNQTLTVLANRRSELYDNINNELVRNKVEATKITKEHEQTRNEGDQRIMELEECLEKMQLEIEHQKSLVIEERRKYKERSDTISDLELANDLLDLKNQKFKDDLERKKQEIEKLRRQLTNLKETQNSAIPNMKATESELTKAKEAIRTHDIELKNIRSQLDQERQTVLETKKELKIQKKKNASYLDLINKQKLDLEQLRTNMNSSPAALTAEEKKTLIVNETNLAREQIKAEYLEEITSLKQQRDQITQNLEAVIAEAHQVKENINLMSIEHEDQKQQIVTLLQQLDEQNQLVSTIHSDTQSVPSQKSKWSTVIYYLPWFLLIYCIFIISILKPSSCTDDTSHYVYYSPLQLLDEMYYMYAGMVQSTAKSVVDKLIHRDLVFY
ncbi:MAG: hypothetical protein EXX96DRAFT_71847 [Benjaminiella poitrasii]|nr:MAG: hypothetical protein EXX96DRAFT_71847 [Benjaminiella poitrasii]